MAACQGSTTGELGAILARDVVETFSKRHRFSGKYTYPMICDKIGVAISKMKVAFLFFKIGKETFFISHKDQ